MKTLRRLYQLIFRDKKNYFSFLVLFVVAGSLVNLQPIFVRLISQALTTQQFNSSLMIAIWWGVTLISSNLLYALSYFIGDQGMTKTSINLQLAALKHIHSLDFAYHTNKSSGKLISLMKRGDDAFFTFYHIINRELLTVAISVIIMLIAFTQLPFIYVLASCSFFVVGIMAAIILIRPNIRKRRAFTAVDDDLSGIRVDNLLAFDTVKYFANEQYEQGRFSRKLQEWYTSLLAYFFTFRFFDVIVGNLANIAVVTLIVLGVRDVASSKITLPDFLLISTFSVSVFPQLMRVLFLLRDLAKHYADLEKYLNLLDEPITVLDPDEPVKLNQVKGTLSFKQVGFAYQANQKERDVLHDFSLEVKPGESVALVGYSGAGKTTVLKLLMRMYEPTAGEICIDGVPLHQMEKSYLRSLIGIVPQDPILFNNTIRFNIGYAQPKASDEEIQQASKLAQIHSFIESREHAYETVVGERGIKLSGGQRQRVAIARVFLKQPPIVLLDEATSSLDSESERVIQEAFWKLAKDPDRPRTSIIIAHRLSTVMRADRIVVLEKGKIVETGTHAELIANSQGIYHKLWQLQHDGKLGDLE